MEFFPINLLYFAFTIPIAIITFIILRKIKPQNNLLIKLIILSMFLFIVRLTLVFFADTIGIMPYLKEDVIFYTLLMIFGVIMTVIYVNKIEQVSFKEIGWNLQDIKKSVVYGLVGFIPLVCFFPIIMLLANIQISIAITTGKIIVALSFAILGGFYEEIMFRGIIQNKFTEFFDDDKKIILFTALTFTITHLFYLPFIGFGIFYIFVFVMAVILSILKEKSDQLACAILHGGIVFVLIIAV